MERRGARGGAPYAASRRPARRRARAPVDAETCRTTDVGCNVESYQSSVVLSVVSFSKTKRTRLESSVAVEDGSSNGTLDVKLETGRGYRASCAETTLLRDAVSENLERKRERERPIEAREPENMENGRNP